MSEKPCLCPFCGKELKTDMFRGITNFLCEGCGAIISFRGAEKRDAAIKAINRRAQPANEPLVRCGECAKYQSPQCAAKHEQALMDFCSHGVRKPEGSEE